MSMLGVLFVVAVAAPVGTAQPPASPVASPSPEMEMRFRGMDRNHDGAISRDEWRGNDQSFREHDTNNDGVLSGDEVRPRAWRRIASPSPTTTAASPGASPSPALSPSPSPRAAPAKRTATKRKARAKTKPKTRKKS